MANIISFCETAGKNTGGASCDVQLLVFVFMLLGSAKFTPEECETEASLKAAIKDRINRPKSDPEKLYPWFVANGGERTTEEDASETALNGETRVLRIAPESYNISSWSPGLNQVSAMIAFNGTTLPAFTFDNDGKMVGKYDADGNFVGSLISPTTKGGGFATFAAGPNTVTRVSFKDPYALNVNARVYEFSSFDFEDYTGLMDAELITVVAPTGNAHKIGVVVDNRSISKGKQNMYTLYDDELADVDLWYGIATSNGATVAPTSVVKDATLKAWTVTFAAAVDAIGLVSPAILFTNGVKGIEGVELAA